jgi:hypothetical protein
LAAELLAEECGKEFAGLFCPISIILFASENPFIVRKKLALNGGTTDIM